MPRNTCLKFCAFVGIIYSLLLRIEHVHPNCASQYCVVGVFKKRKGEGLFQETPTDSVLLHSTCLARAIVLLWQETQKEVAKWSLPHGLGVYGLGLVSFLCSH